MLKVSFFPLFMSHIIPCLITATFLLLNSELIACKPRWVTDHDGKLHLLWQFLHSCILLRTYNSTLHPLVVSLLLFVFQDSIRELAFCFAVLK